MRNASFKRIRISIVFTWFVAVAALAWLLAAQNPEMQQRIAMVKEAAARNKQELAQYTWVEQDTIILKGEQKKQEQFQVRLGPDGKPQKTPLDAAAPAESSGHEGRLKKHIVEKKKEEYKEYADQIRELIRQYLPPDKDALEQARQKGNIMVGAAGSPGEYRAVISNYIKPGDNMTLVMDPAQKNIVRLSIATYLDDPKDVVKVDAEFSPMPGGPNHISSATINGVSKQLTITIQNSNYQRL